MRTDMKNREKLLPSHPTMRSDFRGDDDAFWRQLEEITTSVLPIRSVHEKWKISLKPGLSYETLGSDLATIHHLMLLIQLMGCRRVLEVGTFVGVSTLFLAEAVGPGGLVTTVEIGAEFAELARENIKANGMADRVEVLNYDINAILPALVAKSDPYDLVFLDGSKQDYGRLLRPLIDLLAPGGLLFVDNMFFHGDALNDEPITAKGIGVRALLDEVKTIFGCPKVILPYGDGHLLLLKAQEAK